ncbi:ThuA-like domain-containing protein, partial [Cercophora newfieldiana]
SSDPFQVLLFSRTTAYRHASIPAGIAAITRLASSHRFTVHATEDPTVFSPSHLSTIRVVILLQCSGDFLDTEEQLDALKGFVHSGGGVVGIHCASFAMEGSEWYGRLIGAVFESHPAPTRERVWVVEGGHAIVKGSLGKGGIKRIRGEGGDEEGEEWEWEWLDEWYRFKAGNGRIVENKDLTVLLEGGDLGKGNPVAWCQEFEGGRSFYTSLGHFDEAYEDEGFMAQILGGILWTA